MAKKELERVSEKKLAGRCDIHRDENMVMLDIEMPGVSKEDLDIRVENDKLTITGRKSSVQGSGRYLIKEIREGVYEREFTLDETIDKSKIDALLEKGLLRLKLHIKESEKPRKIQVAVG